MTNFLKVSILNNLNTGYIFIDVIISLLALLVCSNYDFAELYNKFFKIDDKDEISLSLFCEEVKNWRGTRLKGTDTFKSILVHIQNNIKNDNVTGLRKIKEYFDENDFDCFDTHDNQPLIFMVNQKEGFKINCKDEIDILFKMEVKDQEQEEDKQKVKTRLYELKLIAERETTLKNLQNYVDNKLKNYLKYLETHDDNLYVFDYSGIDHDSRKTVFKKNKFFTTCQMSSLFFEGKEELLRKIYFFRDNKEWYESKSKPYTLGICTYGHPGCGKTSFEKALAKMLDRHIITVDISKIKSSEEADGIFFKEKINDKIIPYEKRIYVFPDFDCQSEITKKRLNINDNESITSEEDTKKDNIIVINQDQDIIKDLMNKNKQEKINLSKLLNILDGIPERTGQIMIFNTNHPENLDPALLRPGRMDIIHNFDKANINDTFKIVQNYYDTYISKEEQNKYKVSNKKYTPAQLFNIFGNYDRLYDALNDLENWEGMLSHDF